MSAQPIHDHDADDPAAILDRLPEEWHGEFLQQYRDALDAAHEVRQYQALRGLLHQWRLRAVALSDPGFEAAAQQAREAQPEDLFAVPGWADER